MTCEKCQSPDLFKMELTVSEEPAHFALCRACEHRWWTQEGATGPLELREMLAS